MATEDFSTKNAERVLRQFLDLKSGERVLLVTDKTGKNTDTVLVKNLKKAAAAIGASCKELVVTPSTKKTELCAALDDADVLWMTWDGQENPEMEFYAVVAESKARRIRFASSPGVTADVFREGGAMTESPDELRKRLRRMHDRLKGLKGLRIVTDYGTDLKVKLSDKRRWDLDTGVIKPGEWSNLPAGEIYFAPEETEGSGTLVLPILHDEITMNQGVDAPVFLTILGGKIVAITGGASAEQLREYLGTYSKSEHDPLSPYQFAEVAFGANAHARPAVADPSADYTHPRICLTESEKAFGMHFAFGCNQFDIPGVDGGVESKVHLDFVIPLAGLTVTGFKNFNDLRWNRNGETLVENGSRSFFE